MNVTNNTSVNINDGIMKLIESKDIIFLTRKVHFQYAHFCRRIILEQCLLISVLTSLCLIIRTTIDFPAVFVNHCKVIRQVYTIII